MLKDKWGGIVALVLLFAGATPAGAQEVYSLERAIGYSLANSSVIEAAEQALAVAGQQVREAWGSALPDITANASYQRNLRIQEAFLPAIIFDPTASPDDLVPVRFGSDNQWNAGLSATQPLFQVDVFVGVGAAARYRSLQQEVLRGTSQGVVTGVRFAYLNALLAEERLLLTRNTLERVSATLADTRSRNRAGLVSNYDVLRMEVELSNIEPEVRRAENAVLAARRTLAVELGMESDAPIAVEGRLVEIDLENPRNNTPENLGLLTAVGLPLDVEISFASLYEVALRRRSDLRQQRLNIVLQETRGAVERANYFPKLSVFGNYSITAQEDGRPTFFGGPNQRTTAAATGLRVELPIFNGFAREARVAQARATVRQNEAQLDRLERVAANDVRNQLENLEETQLRLRSRRRAVEQATRGFEIATAEYAAGIGSQLQVTDSEEALRQAEFNHAQAVYDYLMARAQLEAVVGMVPDAAGSIAARIGTGEGEE